MKASTSLPNTSLAIVVHPDAYPFDVSLNNSYTIVDSSQSTLLNLPNTPVTGNRFFFKDGTGDSGANPITIEGNGNTIDSFGDYTIQLSYGFVGLLFDGFEWKVINQ